MMDDELRGLFPAFVTNIKDPEKRGRIKVICSDVFGDVNTESGWCDPCVPVAFDGGGDICVPNVGEGVWVTFANGDIDAPVYLGGWWQEKQTLLDIKEYNKEVGKIRYINFENCFIRMIKDSITLFINNDPLSPIEISITEGNVTIGGNVNINGTLTVNGNEVVTGDAMISGKSFIGHKHRDSVGGNTTQPI